MCVFDLHKMIYLDDIVHHVRISIYGDEYRVRQKCTYFFVLNYINYRSNFKISCNLV